MLPRYNLLLIGNTGTEHTMTCGRGRAWWLSEKVFKSWLKEVLGLSMTRCQRPPSRPMECHRSRNLLPVSIKLFQSSSRSWSDEQSDFFNFCFFLFCFCFFQLLLQSWTNFFGTLAFISVQLTFFGLQKPPPSPPFNVKLVHFQPCTLFSPKQHWMAGRGLQKNPEYVIKSDLKDKRPYCPNEFVHDCLNKGFL